ncbi:MAG: class I adenylate-forming enzyme family protein, partial [Acidobacteriota bacterium]
MDNLSNIRELLESRLAADPAKNFLISEADAREWTYSEFNAAVNSVANLLLSNSIGKGDVVSLLLPNSAEYVIAYFACFKIGAIAGPINSLLKPAEIVWALGNSESKLLLASTQLAEG